MSNNIGQIAAIQAAESPQKGVENEALKKAVADFEAIFIDQMLKSMRSTIVKSDLLDGGQAEETYNSMMDHEVSRFIASGGGIGLQGVLMNAFGVDNVRGSMPAGPLMDQKAAPVAEKSALDKIGAIAGKIIEKGVDKLTMPVMGWISSRFGYRKDPFDG